MAITTSQMRTTLKTMADFAPALMKAQEILQSAEEAQATLDSIKPAQDAAQQTLAAIATQAKAAQAELASLTGQLNKEKAEIAVEKAAATKLLKDVQVKLKLAQEALTATQNDHANTLAANKQELDGLNIVMETKRKELAAFRQAIPKTY